MPRSNWSTQSELNGISVEFLFLYCFNCIFVLLIFLLIYLGFHFLFMWAFVCEREFLLLLLFICFGWVFVVFLKQENKGMLSWVHGEVGRIWKELERRV